MIFYALMSILCLFYDISTFQSFFMNFYDFMPSGSPGFINIFVMADSETNTLSQLTTDDINIYSSGNFTQ